MVEKLAKRYKAKTPNPSYNGKTCGIRFEDGTAFFDEMTVKPELGLSADQIAERMKTDFGYTVEVLGAK